jgi:Methyltransferase domain/C-methyltransferase C-terminal domain
MSQSTNCPNCFASRLNVFYHVSRVPVHSVLLMETRERAVTYPKGDIALGYCAECGFVSNTLFNPGLHNYSGECEETQGFSPTFQEFHKRLAADLVDRYDLHGKKIIEIGCGKGEFLTLLCELGGNSGVGFDPAFVKERNPAGPGTHVEFIEDFYGEKYTHVEGDFVCSKMTLEHIPDTASFLGTVRRSIGQRNGTPVFFQVPDLMRVLRDLAFWDIYYEHCSYFSAPSLVRLFEETGFEVDDVWTDYDDQYLMICARAVSSAPRPYTLEITSQTVAGAIKHFATNQEARISARRRDLCERQARGERIVVWGSGSKGVAFLTALDLNGAIEYVVDINPFRQGKYMPGTGQKIVAPSFLADYKPNLAIAMNPIYRREIQADLRSIGLATTVQTV